MKRNKIIPILRILGKYFAELNCFVGIEKATQQTEYQISIGRGSEKNSFYRHIRYEGAGERIQALSLKKVF